MYSAEVIENKGDALRSCTQRAERMYRSQIVARKSEDRAGREASAETLRLRSGHALRALRKRRGELGSRSVEVGRDRRVSSGRGQKRAASSVIDKDSTDLAVCLLESI